MILALLTPLSHFFVFALPSLSSCAPVSLPQLSRSSLSHSVLALLSLSIYLSRALLSLTHTQYSRLLPPPSQLSRFPLSLSLSSRPPLSVLALLSSIFIPQFSRSSLSSLSQFSRSSLGVFSRSSLSLSL